MWYPEVKYERIDPKRLELYSWDGTYRAVMFRTAEAAELALKPGRADIDCSAVLKGFLPSGSFLVSRPGWRPDLPNARSVASAQPDVEPADGETRSGRNPKGDHITEETDRAARRSRTADAARYDSMVLDMAGG